MGQVFDCIVVGGGLVGSAVAYGVCSAGGTVALLDEGDVAYRASRGNFGQLWVQGKGRGKPPYAELTKAAAVAVRALAAMKSAIVDAEDELGRIDAVAGDGDHGRGMVKGVSAAATAAADAADQGHGVQGVLDAAGDAWAAKAGGTSGVLWGAALRALGDRLGDQPAEITDSDVVAAVTAGLDALVTLGKAKVGDKTMLDSLVPFVDSLREQVGEGTELVAAWQQAAEISERAAQDTAQLRPQIGRARPLAERSLGTPDAGAISMALCLGTVGQVLADH